MKMHKKNGIMLASAITASCAACLAVSGTLLMMHRKKSRGHTEKKDIVYEEDAGDSYEI
jgi:hypothetical protein